MNIKEITTQVTRPLDEIRVDLNSQMLEVINSAIAEKVLPSIQKVLGVQVSGLNSARDYWYGTLDRSPEDRLSSMDLRSGRLECSLSGRSGRTDHRSKRPNCGPVGNFGQKDHQSRGLDRSPEDRPSDKDHLSLGLDYVPRNHSGRTHQRSDKQDGSLIGHFRQVFHRSSSPIKVPDIILTRQTTRQ